MKIDRRSFLSFAIGGAAGTALSPLPWKLTDDSSIWSQNWAWTPVPRDGEYTTVDTVCTLCPGGCGITVRMVDDRAVKIEGMAGHPVNNGGICLLGLSGLQLLYGPTRVKAPMKRVGPRGEGQWQEISWEDAIAEVAAKLTAIREAGAPQSVACLAGSDMGVTAALIDRFLAVYGSPNFLRMPSMEDSMELAIYRSHGVVANAGYDLDNADFILSFGSGLIEGWGSPVRMFQANSSWKDKGVQVVQIEARQSTTAAKASTWLAITPGTEMTLALGLAHVIISEGLGNQAFVSGATGFDAFKRTVLADYAPNQVSRITGVDTSTIISLARRFAAAARPLALCGRGRGRQPLSAGEASAVHALNALTGSVNREGGVLAVPNQEYIDFPEPETDATASAGLQAGRVDRAGAGQYADVRYLTNRLTRGAYDLQALFVSGANPVFSLPGTAAVKSALNAIPFLVSFSSYMDETAAMSDLILPNHQFLERYEDVPTPAGFPRQFLSLAKPVVEPQFNTRHTGDVIIALAGAVGGPVADAFEWDSYEACLSEVLGDQWDTLNEDVYSMEDELPEAVYETDAGAFTFPSGTFDAVEAEGDAAGFPLLLLPYDYMRLASGHIGDPPFTMKTVEDTVLKGNDMFVEVNPKTAKALGLRDGRKATLETPKGKADVLVRLFEGVMPGVVAMPRGLGHTAYDDYLAGKGQNVNDLIGSVEDPASGLDAVWGIRAKLG